MTSKPAVELRRIRLVRDDADGAGLGARAVQRALRTGEHFDARDVVDLDVERALDRGDRLLVEVHADRRQRTRVVGVLAAGDAAHVRARETGAAALERHVRQEFHVVVEGLDLEVRELLLADGLDRQRHVLKALVALQRGDDDFVEAALVGLLCLCDAGAREHGARVWQRAPHGGGKGEVRTRNSADCCVPCVTPYLFVRRRVDAVSDIRVARMYAFRHGIKTSGTAG